MQVHDLEGVVSLEDHVVIELVPWRCGGEFWTGEFGEWMEEYAVGYEDGVEGESSREAARAGEAILLRGRKELQLPRSLKPGGCSRSFLCDDAV
jgi:hypothetical protein